MGNNNFNYTSDSQSMLSYNKADNSSKQLKELSNFNKRLTQYGPVIESNHQSHKMIPLNMVSQSAIHYNPANNSQGSNVDN